MKNRTNQEWLNELTGPGNEQAHALEDLRAMLLRGALYTLRRTRYDVSRLGNEGVEQLAEDCAQDALLEILKQLATFRGESKFTTWAYKFAVNITLVRARHESWKHVSLDHLLSQTERDDLEFSDTRTEIDPDRAPWQIQVRRIIVDAIKHDLSPRQRQVLVALVFEDVPLDELASHFNTNRNAMYKLVHDARLKLKARLLTHGLSVPDAMDLFALT